MAAVSQQEQLYHCSQWNSPLQQQQLLSRNNCTIVPIGTVHCNSSSYSAGTIVPLFPMEQSIATAAVTQQEQLYHCSHWNSPLPQQQLLSRNNCPTGRVPSGGEFTG